MVAATLSSIITGFTPFSSINSVMLLLSTADGRSSLPNMVPSPPTRRGIAKTYPWYHLRSAFLRRHGLHELPILFHTPPHPSRTFQSHFQHRPFPRPRRPHLFPQYHKRQTMLRPTPVLFSLSRTESHRCPKPSLYLIPTRENSFALFFTNNFKLSSASSTINTCVKHRYYSAIHWCSYNSSHKQRE